MPVDFPAAGVNVDWSTNVMRGAARLLIADPSVPFPDEINDIVRTAATAVNEVQTITVTGTPAGGTFTLSFKGYMTAAIVYNASSAVVVAALESLASIGAGGVTATGGPLPGTPVVVTFADQLGGQNVPLIGNNDAGLTGGTTPNMTIVQTTEGFGQWSAQAAWLDLGETKGGVTVGRGNTEEVFTVDQILAELASQPTGWSQTVATNIARVDLEMLQYLWEGGDITVDGVTGERHLPLGSPPCYRQRKLAVGFQRPSIDCADEEAPVGFFVFRKTQRSAEDSSLVLNSTGDQSQIPFTWRCIADQNVQDKYARFGEIIEQAA